MAGLGKRPVFYMSFLRPKYTKSQKAAAKRGVNRARKYSPGGAAGIARSVAKKAAKKISANPQYWRRLRAYENEARAAAKKRLSRKKTES